MHERDSEKLTKDWIFPRFSLLEEHMAYLKQHHGGAEDHIEGSGTSFTTLELMQRERGLYNEVKGRYL